VTKQFQPSPPTPTPEERQTAQLRYLKKAAAYIETSRRPSEPYPAWVSERIEAAAQHLAPVIAYIQYQEKKKKFKEKP
jgi:hypothetical protein